MNDVAVAAPAPLASDDAASDAIARLGHIARSLSFIETKHAETVAKAKATAESLATPLLEEKLSLESRVRAYCEGNRARLTGLKTKTIMFPAGNVAWRDGVERVEIDESLTEKILDALQRIRGFYVRFSSTTVRVSKSKMKAASEAEKAKLAKIKGIHFVPGEEGFIITPAGAALADRPAADDE